jgi:hypothetical protein
MIFGAGATSQIRVGHWRTSELKESVIRLAMSIGWRLG